ncbi:MAG: hypothetical protein DMF25_11820 [Verrucomicrobia bacterium]|nr:MAG: hypothetical protein DMF25_11820 [Verrucomicrobiota bacterium]
MDYLQFLISNAAAKRCGRLFFGIFWLLDHSHSRSSTGGFDLEVMMYEWFKIAMCATAAPRFENEGEKSAVFGKYE